MTSKPTAPSAEPGFVGLDDPVAGDTTLTGGKASRLAALRAQGLPVPDGVVVLNPPTAWSPVAVERLAAKLAAIEARAGGPVVWAVRSSALAEDLATASFAGQYATILGARDPAGVIRAVQTCRASFDRAAARGYAAHRGLNLDTCRGAVLVQRLIVPDAAGVCFSADPVTGDMDRIVINANYGLGESVAGGTATPDVFVLRKSDLAPLSENIGAKDVEIVVADDGVRQQAVDAARRSRACLDETQRQQVGELARRVETLEGQPVDIEWALANGAVYLLQSRPITTGCGRAAPAMPGPPPDWVPELNSRINPAFPLYSNGNIGEVLPGCVTPLSWSLVSRHIEHAFLQQLLAAGTLPVPGPDHDPVRSGRVIALFFHRPYLCVSYLVEYARRTPGLSPDLFWREFVGEPVTPTPAFSRGDLSPARILGALRALWASLTRLRRLRTDLDRCRSDEKTMRAASSPEALRASTDGALLDRVRFDPRRPGPAPTHVWASGFAMLTYTALGDLCRRWLGDDHGALAAALVTGIGGLPSAEPALGLAALARLVRTEPSLEERFSAQADETRLMADIRSLDTPAGARFCSAFDEFLDRFGHRAACEAELRLPCWREDPAQVIRMVRTYLQDGGLGPEEIRRRQQDRRERARASVRTQLRGLRRLLFELLVDRTSRYLTYREQLKDLVVRHADHGRRTYQEIRRRLLERRRLGDPDDLYFLLADEVEALLTGAMSAADAGAIVTRRRQDFAWCEQVHVPKIQEGRPRVIDLATLPPTQRLEGLRVSPGKAQGRARVVLDPRADCRIEPGEILVAPVTDAGWSPLFVHAAGLVVEVGGPLSHGSIIAREYGLPAVVGAAGATRVIRTGDQVLVDGDAGCVLILSADGK